MKKPLFRPILMVAVMLLGFCNGIKAQNFDNIAAAFKKGDASAIAKHFDGNVVITIKNGGTPYSRSQAEIVLKNFFTSHAPKTFDVLRQGTSPEGTKYFIGTLTTGSGNYRSNYRTYVKAKVANNALVIQEIRFEEQQ